MYDCLRRFFFAWLMPKDFQREHINFPVSLLGGIVDDVMFQNDIHRTNFPPSWGAPRALKTTPAQTSGGGGGGGERLRTTQRQIKRDDSEEGQEEVNLKHMHPKLKNHLHPCTRSLVKSFSSRSQELIGASCPS
jgi:hypothetical protein